MSGKRRYDAFEFDGMAGSKISRSSRAVQQFDLATGRAIKAFKNVKAASEEVGIGVARITGNLEGFKPDFAYRIEDAEFLPILFDLVKHEGLSLGGSAGVNIAGAVRLARELGPGKTIVTCLCDPGSRYASKLFNPAFLSSKGLPVPDWA